MLMRVVEIKAYGNRIILRCDGDIPEGAVGYARVPLVRGRDGRHTQSRVICESQCVENGMLIFPRYKDEYDLSICRFEIAVQGKVIGGMRYVTELSSDFSKGSRELSPKGKPVGTWVTCRGEDMDLFGFGGMMTEINSTWIQTLEPEDGDIPHIWNGRTYWFSRPIMATYDSFMQACIERGIPCLVRLINRFSYRLKGSDDKLRSVIGHPDYEDTGFSEQMSAFNITNEKGLDMYCACVDFLCKRYADVESPLFCSVIMDVGNEVNAQATWHNCGQMECRDFTEEYSEQLRLAHLIGQKYNACHRVHISLDHYYSVALKSDPLRYYGGREMLAYLAAICRRDGDFPWGISAHPYPENLTKPDFYNDTTATFTNDTIRITMKNMELWQAIAEHPALRYRGEMRRIVFDEQGFHTDYEDAESENKGAYAFVLLWQKLKRCSAVEQFLINRYTDMPQNDEGGLHLGLRYEKGYADAEHLFIHPGAYKKISYAIMDMGTDAEARWIDEARAYIGEELFDSLLDPTLPPRDGYFDEIADIVGID